MTAKSRDAFALSEYFNATTTADSRRERARKEKDQRKKVKDDKIQNSNCKGKGEGENGKRKTFLWLTMIPCKEENLSEEILFSLKSIHSLPR